MTEAEWLASDDPKGMLDYIAFQIDETSYGLVPGVSDRRLLLFAEQAGCRICDDLFRHDSAAMRAEFVAGTSCRTPAEKAAILRDIFGNPFRPVRCPECCRGNILTDNGDEDCPECGGTGGMSKRWLRWHAGLIPAIASTIYDGQLFDQMPILADALEEAGCANENILMHLRGWEPFGDPANPGWRRCGYDGKPLTHVRGCFVLDLLLGKE